MHSETLRACGILIESVWIQEKGYFLAAARRSDRRLLVEITPAGSGYTHPWPSSARLVPPVEARNLPGELRLLVFDTGSGVLLWESRNEKPFGFSEAVRVLEATADTLAGLQASGLILGYAGPENLVRETDGRILVLAGRRGIPSNPFAPPEAVGRRPFDPRSDVFTLGTLLLRLMAGSDDREALVTAWNGLRADLVRDLSALLERDPLQRPDGVVQGVRALSAYATAPKKNGEPAPGRSPFGKEAPSPPKPLKRRSRRKFPLMRILIPLLVAAVLLLVLKPWGTDGNAPQPPLEGFRTVPPDPAADRGPEPRNDTPPDPGASLVDTAVIWVSNSTGEDGREDAFRAGPAGSYSFVYPARGGSRRRSSLVLVRRETPDTPLAASSFYPVAARFASEDSSMAVRATDATILLGTDLYHPGLNQGYFAASSEPPGTLFVDIANHGIQYTLEGMGAASWTGSRLDGKMVEIQGSTWVISVSDVRDGDRLSDEIGIPSSLETTIFLYRPGSPFGEELEATLRSVFQALPSAVQGPPEGVPVPDIHVLLGAP